MGLITMRNKVRGDDGLGEMSDGEMMTLVRFGIRNCELLEFVRSVLLVT